ncbi:hypothetical protein V8B97DRAFT_1181617 [Scleroderma yunnanense]
MPKSSKKRKEKAADFTKAKLKLGKGKRLPSNVVDTSFKARSIALPTQSITVEKDNVPTTKRKRTFNDILSLLKHYNASVRKDAISSAKELFEDFPDLVKSHMPPLFGSCARLIGDEDAGVRKTLLSFFDWLLPRVPKDDLLPHAPLLLLFTTSAQTHIFPEIRIDGIRFLDLFMAVLPEAVVTGWDTSGSGPGRRVLDGYLGLLNSGTKFGASGDDAPATSTSAVILSSQSRLVVLRSLSNFLRCTARSQPATDRSIPNPSQATPSLPTWFLRPFFANTNLYEEHSHLFRTPRVDRREKQMRWTLRPSFESFDEDFAYNMHSIPEVPSTLTELLGCSTYQDKSASTPDEIAMLMRLARTLFSTLSVSYLDCAPVVFSPSVNPPETDLQLLTAAMEITRTLYSVVLQSTTQGSDIIPSCNELKTLIGYLTGHFPFKPAHRDTKVEQAFQNLNVIYCELTSLVVLVSSWWSSEAGQHGDTSIRSLSRRLSLKYTKTSKLDIQTELVRSYVVRVLNGEGESGDQLPRPLMPSVYIALLPSVWALLNYPSGPGVNSDEAVTSSAVKRLTVEFVARLLLLEKERGYIGCFNPTNHCGRWVTTTCALPKPLYKRCCASCNADHPLSVTSMSRPFPPVSSRFSLFRTLHVVTSRGHSPKSPCLHCTSGV